MREEPNGIAANRVDTEFRSKISYEIRTAMNDIIGTTNVLLDSELSPEKVAFLQIIKSSADQLMAITEELLARGTGF